MFVLRHPPTRRRYLIRLDETSLIPAWMAPCDWIEEEEEEVSDDNQDDQTMLLLKPPPVVQRRPPRARAPDAEADFLAYVRAASGRRTLRLEELTAEDALAERRSVLAGLMRLGASPAHVADRLNDILWWNGGDNSNDE